MLTSKQEVNEGGREFINEMWRVCVNGLESCHVKDYEVLRKKNGQCTARRRK